MMNFSNGEMKIIKAIAKGSKTPTEVSNATGLARRSTYTGIKNLVAAGIIVKGKSLRDTRKVILSFTN